MFLAVSQARHGCTLLSKTLCYWTDLKGAMESGWKWPECKAFYARDVGAAGVLGPIYIAAGAASRASKLCGGATFVKLAPTRWTEPVYMVRRGAAGHRQLGLVNSIEVIQGITGSTKWTMFDSKPVAFVSPKQTELASVELIMYWSAKRGDAMLSARVPSKSGNYVPKCIVGYAASKPQFSREPMAPLWGYYNRMLKDNFVGPISSARDLNAIIGASSRSPWDAYRGGRHLVGYGWHGQCAICNTTALQTWGNLGGPGCPSKTCSGKFFGFFLRPPRTRLGAFRESQPKA